MMLDQYSCSGRQASLSRRYSQAILRPKIAGMLCQQVSLLCCCVLPNWEGVESVEGNCHHAFTMIVQEVCVVAWQLCDD